MGWETTSLVLERPTYLPITEGQMVGEHDLSHLRNVRCHCSLCHGALETVSMLRFKFRLTIG